MMQKPTISHNEEATTDVQIKFPVGDIIDGHHKSRCQSLGLNRDTNEPSVANGTKKKSERISTVNIRKEKEKTSCEVAEETYHYE